MDQNRDWKPMAALVLAGLALFVALSGSRDWHNDSVSVIPPQIAFAPIAPEEFKAPAQPEGRIILPPMVSEDQRYERMWAGWEDGHSWKGGWIIFPFFWLLLVVGLIFLAMRMFRRRGWGGPGWYGGPGPQGPPQGPPYQQPFQQYPPQYGQGQPGQPYGGYPQGQQYPPQYGQPYQQYPPQHGQGQPGPQGQANQAPQGDDAHGDITRPEGSS